MKIELEIEVETKRNVFRTKKKKPPVPAVPERATEIKRATLFIFAVKIARNN
jgi:hypothetical protein